MIFGDAGVSRQRVRQTRPGVKWVAKSVTAQGSLARAPLDTRIVIVGDWEELADRLEGALAVMREIAGIAGTKG
jgi:hypothetical protein